LIPLLAPEYTDGALARHFSTWFTRITGLADGFFVNSAATWNDLKTELRARGRDAPVGLIPLAHEFSEERSTRHSGPVRDRVLAAARQPFVLFVGTIEPRKNALGVALVWRRLIAEFGSRVPHLVFAGKLGWMYQDFVKLMTTSGQLSGHAIFVDRPTDRELGHLYSNCLFTVYPSYYEGWGLPVGESLWFGRTVVTSNTGSMPEVGGDMCSYADPHDLDDVYEKVKKLVFDGDFRNDLEKRITRDRLRTWSQVAKDMWAELNALPPPFPRP
jgi:glycosyltransferase involved in cell wall biosynthesis